MQQAAPEARQRPLVTFALLAFRQAHCVERALSSALAQTYSPLEIILSDDGSDDATYALMEKAAAEYEGPHTIVLNRNTRNLGIGAHVNAIGGMARGELIVLAAGDDVSLPQRVAVIVERWQVQGRPEAYLCSDYFTVDAAGRSLDIPVRASRSGPFGLERMARGDIRVKGATAAATRNLFRSFAPIDPSVRCEDRVLPFRAQLLGGQVIFIAEKLVEYCAEGGVSELKARWGREHLLHHGPKRLALILPDAVQRLADLQATAPERKALIRACTVTIRNQQAGIDLPKHRGIALELRTLLWLARGARPVALLKLYFKLRFLALTVRHQQRRHRGG